MNEYKGRRELYFEVWPENLKISDHSEDEA
jgi:hypothetical protein